MTVDSRIERRTRHRVIFGRVRGADAGDIPRQILVGLGDGSALTMSLDTAVVSRVSGVLGRDVELRVRETVVGEAVVDRAVETLRLLDPGECGIDAPPKSIDELAREQGVDRRPRADYFEILSGLWETEEEADAFRSEIRAGRGKAR